VNRAVAKTKPSFLEAGLPCASLSAECQRDNNARQRPPQNRLHIWWARRPPTISRAAILAALLPYDLQLDEAMLPPQVDEPSEDDLDNLPPKLREHRAFFERLLAEVEPTTLTPAHRDFLLGMGITGDSHAAWRRMALRQDYLIGTAPILLPMDWTYRHPPAFGVSPSEELLLALLQRMRSLLGLGTKDDVVLLDSMAGGGSIPVEGVRYGLKTFANELNPVASTVLKATMEYPARFGRNLGNKIRDFAGQVDEAVRKRLLPFFYIEPPKVWWAAEKDRARSQFKARAITKREPAEIDSSKNCYLWCRIVPCAKCALKIPISTNFLVVSKKSKPEASLAAFPEVPKNGKSSDCTFRIVPRSEWKNCKWPRPDFDKWDPRGTPTFQDGKAICPRCGHVMDGDQVKAIARSREGGLASQMYAVCSQVPVKLTYKDGTVKVRHMWRFRAPTQADLDAVEAAEAELAKLHPQWEAQDLIPSEEIPEGDKTREPRNMGLVRWRDLFLPRQLLTNVVVLDEIRAAQKKARAEPPEAEAEAVAVYLAFILSKVVNYNSVSTFWDYTRNKGAQTFSRYDFAFRAAFSEFEGARETIHWAASQILGAYEQLSNMIHGEEVSLEGGDEDEAGDVDPDDVKVDNEESEAGCQASRMNLTDSLEQLRPEVIVPTVTCEDAAALSTPKPGTVHLICVDPPYYSNVQYCELSNFFYVWLKRALRDVPALAPLFREPLVECNREAVANNARFLKAAETDQAAWQTRFDAAFQKLRDKGMKAPEAKEKAKQAAGPVPLTAKERADQFYEDKMAAVFRRARQLLHPAGRMVVMFNHKQTWAWRALGMAIIRAGFEIRSSVPIHTEAESSLNIRGLDAARSTVLLLCQPRDEKEQPPGNWSGVQDRVAKTAQGAAERFQKQGVAGTDLYLSALGPAIGEVGRNWPVTDYAGRQIDLIEALEEAYKAVGGWRLNQIFDKLTREAKLIHPEEGFTAETVDRDTQTLWLWLDTFQGEIADSDDVRKLAKSLNVDPDDFRRAGLLSVDKDLFILREPMAVDLRLLSRRLKGEEPPRGRAAREADVWEERVFPNFIGAAVWNAIGLMAGQNGGPKGVDAVRRWLRESGYGTQREFRGAFAVTLYLLETAFAQRKEDDPWRETAHQARRAWDLVLARK
jgi:adenine-specific DNA methylase